MKNRVLTSSLLICLVLQFALIGFAQQSTAPKPQPSPTPSQPRPASSGGDDDVVRITTNLVQVDSVITDSNGKPVTDLRPEEVQILEDGKPQTITNFSFIPLDPPVVRKAPKPDKNDVPVPPIRLRPDQVRRTIALVVDDLGLSFESAHFVRQALRKFLDQQMQPYDLVAIIRTAGGIGALQQFTSDKRQLYAAVEKVRWYPSGRGLISTFAPMGANSAGSGSEADMDQFRTDLFAVGTLGAVNYVVKGLGQLPGRKSIILLSDGLAMFNRSEPTGSVRVIDAMNRLTEMANRASVVIYTVDARGLPTLGYSAADNTSSMTPAELQTNLSNRRGDFFESQGGLQYLSEQTGGLSIQNTNDLSGGIKRAIEDQGGYYLIGYRPEEDTFESNSGRRKFHKLSLKISRPGKFKVRMRNGFYGITDEEANPRNQSGVNRFMSALISPFGTEEINVRLTSLFANDPSRGSIMRSLLHVKASDLTFAEEPDGWHKASFDILALTFGDNGIVVDRLGKTHTMRVKGKTYDRIMREGFTYYITVPVKKAGAYQLRTAVRDTSSERIGSATQFIEVPDFKKNRLTLSGIVLNGVTKEAYLKGQSSSALPQDTDDTADAGDAAASPAMRQFKSGMVMVYGYHIYNARLDKVTKKPQLLTRIRLFRNGKEIFSGTEVSIDATNQTDMKRLVVTGAIQLGTELVPGEYVFQVITTDTLASGKERQTTQWIDFEIK